MIGGLFIGFFFGVAFCFLLAIFVGSAMRKGGD